MDNIKVRLSLCIQGAQMLSPQECGENSYNTSEFILKDKRGKKKVFVVNTRKQRLIKQNINLTQEAYDYMTDPKVIPDAKYAKKVNKKKTMWAEMSRVKRLKVHLDAIAAHFNAVSYTFEVLDD